MNAIERHGVSGGVGWPLFSYFHEAAHGIDFGMEKFDRKEINERLMAMPINDRLAAEAYVIAATLLACASYDEAPPDLNPQSIAINVWSMIRNSMEDREVIRWTCAEYAGAIVDAMTSERSRNLADAVLTIAKETQ